MLVSVEKNFIFIHVAKTGGLTLAYVLHPYSLPKARGQWRRLLSHLPVPEALDARFSLHAPARWAKRKLPRPFFDNAYKFAVVRNPYDLAVSRYFYLRKATTHNRHKMASKLSFIDFLHAEKRRTIWRHCDQSAMLLDSAGRLLVDHVYRFEEIEEAYRDLIVRLELTNPRELPHWNNTERDAYQTYYGAAERRLVEDIWARDFDRFGYSF